MLGMGMNVTLQCWEALFGLLLLLINVFMIKTLIVSIAFRALTVISATLLPKPRERREAWVEESLGFQSKQIVFESKCALKWLLDLGLVSHLSMFEFLLL